MPKHHYFLVHWDGKVRLAKTGKSIILRVTKRRERQLSAGKLAQTNKPAVIEEFRNGVRVSVVEVK